MKGIQLSWKKPCAYSNLSTIINEMDGIQFTTELAARFTRSLASGIAGASTRSEF